MYGRPIYSSWLNRASLHNPRLGHRKYKHLISPIYPPFHECPGATCLPPQSTDTDNTSNLLQENPPFTNVERTEGGRPTRLACQSLLLCVISSKPFIPLASSLSFPSSISTYPETQTVKLRVLLTHSQHSPTPNLRCANVTAIASSVTKKKKENPSTICVSV